MVNDTKRISKLQLEINRLTVTGFVSINPLQLSKFQIKLFCPKEAAGDVLWEAEGPEVLLKQGDGGGAFRQISVCVCVLTKVLLDVYTCTPRYGCADVPSIGNVFVL